MLILLSGPQGERRAQIITDRDRGLFVLQPAYFSLTDVKVDHAGNSQTSTAYELLLTRFARGPKGRSQGVREKLEKDEKALVSIFRASDAVV